MNNALNLLNSSTIWSEQIPNNSLLCWGEFDCQNHCSHLNTSPFEVTSGEESDPEIGTSDEKNCMDPTLSIQRPASSSLLLSSKGSIVARNELSFKFIDCNAIFEFYEERYLYIKGS